MHSNVSQIIKAYANIGIYLFFPSALGMFNFFYQSREVFLRFAKIIGDNIKTLCIINNQYISNSSSHSIL
jgi:hypothetical protein